MSKRPAWWLDFLKTAWPLTRISAKATKWPLIGKLLTPAVIPIFSGKNFNVSYIPVNAQVPGAQSIVLPGRLIEEIINRSAHRVILKHCTCRDSEHCQTYPIEDACLLLGDGTKSIDPRIADHVSVDEAKRHLKRMLEMGLIPMVGRVLMDNYFYGVPNTGKLLTICFCCPCCCTVLNSARYFPAKVKDSFVRLKGLEVTVDSGLCKKCGTCVEACLFNALTLTQHGIVRDPILCKGCGRCASVCPLRAVTVVLDDLHEATEEVLGRIRQRIDFESSSM
jgi:ferredoxin